MMLKDTNLPLIQTQVSHMTTPGVVPCFFGFVVLVSPLEPVKVLTSCWVLMKRVIAG